MLVAVAAISGCSLEKEEAASPGEDGDSPQVEQTTDAPDAATEPVEDEPTE